MQPGPPHQPPLAAKWWLFRHESESDQEHAPGRSMSIESLEHMVRNRVRMFLRHTWLVAILGTLVIVGAVASGIYFWNQAERMRIAAAPLDMQFAHALADQLNRQHRDLHLQIVETPDAEAAAAAISKREVDFALLPSHLDDSLNWPVVGIIRQNVMALIVPAPPAAPPAAAKPKAAETTPPAEKPSAKPAPKKAKAAKSSKSAKATKTAKNAKASDKSDDSDDSDDDDSGKSAKADADKGGKDDSNKLEKVSQLAGKRVGIVTGNEATAGLLELLLGHYGVPIAKVTVSDIKPENVADAVKNNQVDVLFVAGAATGQGISKTVTAATRDGIAPSFIAIDQADGIAKRHPSFDSIDIDAGTFGGSPPTPDDDLKSLSFAEYLVARKSFHESLVAALAKTLYSSRQSLAIAAPGDVKIEAPSTDKDAAIVLHPGALAYLSDSQQSFFDKYGDDIFYGMLIFPVFGSAIAGVASYLLRDTRTRRLRLLQRVLDLVRKAHDAQTLEALDRLQIDADNLVISIIHQSEHEEFDETARMSFSFSLDQLRFAIAARRQAIIDQTGTAGSSAKAAAA
ncbi:MAG TPA: TAXI family TRAP transporter solute-binding subunit [Xanthobacteraceae bacterium]|jgi:hypothetical protein|nr:TAXI family TRAP transporter solute-binding subunit [Xanthobacteraceae bacterium]